MNIVLQCFLKASPKNKLWCLAQPADRKNETIYVFIDTTRLIKKDKKEAEAIGICLYILDSYGKEIEWYKDTLYAPGEKLGIITIENIFLKIKEFRDKYNKNTKRIVLFCDGKIGENSKDNLKEFLVNNIKNLDISEVVIIDVRKHAFPPFRFWTLENNKPYKIKDIAKIFALGNSTYIITSYQPENVLQNPIKIVPILRVIYKDEDINITESKDFTIDEVITITKEYISFIALHYCVAKPSKYSYPHRILQKYGEYKIHYVDLPIIT